MSFLQFNTRVIFASNQKAARICVTTPWDNKWNDCIGLQIYRGGSEWEEVIALSPARARILAEHLIQIAEAKEKLNGKKCIDDFRL